MFSNFSFVEYHFKSWILPLHRIIQSMQTRTPTKDTDIFLDEHEYLTGPLQGLYKTTKNARKYIISGLNSIDEQLKVITYASFNNTLKSDRAISTIEHWIAYLKTMKREIIRFQNLSDFEQDALKSRIDYINSKHDQLRRELSSDPHLAPYHEAHPSYCFPYSVHDRTLLEEHKGHSNHHQKSNANRPVDDDIPMNECNETKDCEPSNVQSPRRSRSKATAPSERHYKAVWMDRLLIDYLSRNGHFKTAYALSDDHNLKMLSNIRLYHKIREPLLALQRRDAVSIIKWCRSNKTLLKEHQVLFLCHSIWW